jgi:D-alanine-D-alanine ligase
MSRKIVVLMGGISFEREVSLKSGKNVVDALKRKGYDAIGIDFVDPLGQMDTIVGSDLVFIALHGAGGEDGKVQGFLETLKIPYIGSNSESSMLCFDKILTYTVLKDEVRIPDYTIVDSVAMMKCPCVIKPACNGSSIGVHICESEKELEGNLSIELAKYGKMIVEEYIKGKEVTISILDINGKPVVLPILELRPKNKFYDYDAKYTPGKTEFVMPSTLTKEEAADASETALHAYKKLGCKDFARVDGIVRNGKFYLFDVNTIPGLTDTSDLPVSAKYFGLSFDDVMETIVKNNI